MNSNNHLPKNMITAIQTTKNSYSKLLLTDLLYGFHLFQNVRNKVFRCRQPCCSYQLLPPLVNAG
ncbi:hypothetical protein HanXRQr2_Chr13g0585431 [Helianthus annuus]|uniref:Uncharacterized protein n=1 Tax=Helianthus annuus TaxID=4232 RepID=A0A9K3EJ08_HELAN|nr:hypothetical protein HanXRQr2_Chr13g0585431 [Helianthus annuus]KAJ0848971.1 hypothetical protein HanPSC8_Chr13g0563601 [Helianthus annuus]